MKVLITTPTNKFIMNRDPNSINAIKNITHRGLLLGMGYKSIPTESTLAHMISVQPSVEDIPKRVFTAANILSKLSS